jgi:hypothetical protein
MARPIGASSCSSGGRAKISARTGSATSKHETAPDLSQACVSHLPKSSRTQRLRFREAVDQAIRTLGSNPARTECLEVAHLRRAEIFALPRPGPYRVLGATASWILAPGS